MSRIIKLHGANAVGKTYLCQRLIEDFNGEPRTGFGEKRLPRWLECDGGLWVTRRGDEISAPKLMDHVDRLQGDGVEFIVFENIYARSRAWREFSARRRIIWAMLNTPWDVCLERMRKRRKSGEPNVEAFLDMRHDQEQSIVLAHEAGVNTTTLDYMEAYDELVGILRRGGWNG